jgi:hypothetical protein
MEVNVLGVLYMHLVRVECNRTLWPYEAKELTQGEVAVLNVDDEKKSREKALRK